MMTPLPVSDILSSLPLSTTSNPTATRVLLRSSAGGDEQYRAVLGECIVYDDASNSILWVDTYGKSIQELSLGGDGNMITYGPYPREVCAIALLSELAGRGDSESILEPPPPGSRDLLVAWKDGFQMCRVVAGSSEIVMELSEYSDGPETDENGTRLNDGRCDRSGRRFICGGYFAEQEGVSVAVYDVVGGRPFSVGGGSQAAIAALTHGEIDGLDMPDLCVTNSICFSPDGSMMYFADSPRQSIFVYDYKTDGGGGDSDDNDEDYVGDSVRLSNKRTVWSAPDGYVGGPDGSCVDAEGFIWNAVWRGGEAPGCVNRIDPKSGKIVCTVELPDNSSQTTCCCFGGPDLDVLFISSASHGREICEEPNAGSIYAVKLDVKGLHETKFTWD